MENHEVPSENAPAKTCCRPRHRDLRPMVPGSLAALILGISSLAGMAFFGFIPAIIGLSKARQASNALKLDPEGYSESSVRMANAGRNMSLIGLILGLLGIVVWILYFYFIFWLINRSGSYSDCGF